MPDSDTTANSVSSPALLFEFSDGFRLWHQTTELKIPIKKCQALLALLTLSPHRKLGRDRLRDLLWSTHSQTSASNNLRQTLHTLRQRFLGPRGLDILWVERDSVSLDWAGCHCDLDQLHQDIQSGAPPQYLLNKPFFFENLLAGLEDIDPAFTVWLREFRAKTEQIVLGSLRAQLHAEGSSAKKAKLAEALNGLDPMDEHACRVLIHHHAATGEPARALAVYQSLWNMLDAEFGEEPSQETQDLIVRLKTGMLDARNTPQNPSERPSQLHIYVDPIDISDLTHRGARLAEGFRLDLIAGLTRFREWRVFDPQAIAQPRQAPRHGYIVELVALGEDEKLRFSLLIREIETGSYVWSERFTILLEDWSQSQNNIVRRIAAALNVHVSSDRIEKIIATEDVPLDIYDRWLMAHNLVMDYTDASWTRAQGIFDRLIQEKPNFARSYASRAGMENTRHMAFPGYVYPPDDRVRILSLALKAVQLDPLDSRTQLAFGWSCAMNGEFDRAGLAFALANQNNENDPWTLISTATGLAFCDQIDDARHLADMFFALELNPSPMHWSYIAAIHFLAGDFDACIVASDRAEQVTTDVPAWHAAALARVGRFDDARVVCDRLVTLARARWASDSPATRAAIANWLAASFPIRNPVRKQDFLNGLRSAGLDDGQTATAPGLRT